ncbi:MAG TPA: metallophosphoesterase [Candidatus Saccharimonadales bacterium]|nr:metallophosphoesterase [Candidatus Saccharimonadales bacterium]
MKVVIFSDVHGNLPATEIMLEDTGPAEAYICLGDIVDYGPWSNECVDLVLSLPNITVLGGNHEEYFLKGHYDGGVSVAQTFFNFCYPKFNRQDKIRNLKQSYVLNDFTFVHSINNQYIYPDTVVSLDKNYVIGHSHHQFKITQPPYVLYNAGSVGQNRRYINIINYLTLETDSMEFKMHAITYNEQLIIQEMKDRGYPQNCIEYYDNKPRFYG